MSASGEWRALATDVPSGSTAKVRLSCGGRSIDGFVVHHGDAYRAWVNRCPHTGTPLDLWPNEFFTEDGQWLICATHGALFEPASGACRAGPCVGDALTPLPLRCDGDEIVVECPRPTARDAVSGTRDHGRE